MTAAQVVPLNVAPVPAATVPKGAAIPQPAPPRPNIAQFIANLGWRKRANANLTAPLAAPPPRRPPMTGLGPAPSAAAVGGPSVLNALPLPPLVPLTSGPWAPPPLPLGSGTLLPSPPMPWPQALVSPASTFLSTAAPGVQSALPLTSPIADPQALQDDALLAAIASRRPALAAVLTRLAQVQNAFPALSGQSLAAPQFDLLAAPLAPAAAPSLGYLTPGGLPVGATDLMGWRSTSCSSAFGVSAWWHNCYDWNVALAALATSRNDVPGRRVSDSLGGFLGRDAGHCSTQLVCSAGSTRIGATAYCRVHVIVRNASQ